MTIRDEGPGLPLAVWNPFYADDALARHAELLADSHRDVGDDAEVWWGLVRSPHRLQPLAHLDDILTLDGEIEVRLHAGHELQLYLTDYQSLYVAEVGRISRDAPPPGDGVAPGSYAREGLACEAWLAVAPEVPRWRYRETLESVRKIRAHHAAMRRR